MICRHMYHKYGIVYAGDISQLNAPQKCFMSSWICSSDTKLEGLV